MAHLSVSKHSPGYTTLYFLFSKSDDTLLYIGVTESTLARRLMGHRKFKRATMVAREMMLFSSREEAEEMETHLILTLKPPLNEATGSRTTGTKQSAEVIAKKVTSRSWYTNTEDHNKKIGLANSTAVRCVETGQIFQSMTAAAEWCGNAQNSGKISQCVSGKRRTHKGYRWELVDRALVGEILPEITLLIQGTSQHETILSEAQ